MVGNRQPIGKSEHVKYVFPCCRVSAIKSIPFRITEVESSAITPTEPVSGVPIRKKVWVNVTMVLFGTMK